jgi:hypothetical protein
MKRLIQVFTVVVVFLLLGMNVATAQATFGPGPAVVPVTAGSNGGFAWGDVDGDGVLDLIVRQNNLFINGISTFTAVSAGLPLGTNECGLGLADFNGDGLADYFGVLTTTLNTGLYINNGNKTFSPMTNSGDLATAGGNSFGFNGIGVADIDHSGYLSIAYPGQPNNALIAGSGANSLPNGGIWLLKGGASGYTNIGRGATTPSIDVTLSYEAWGVSFFDANGDGYPDLLMPSYRNGISRVDAGESGSRKGSVLFLNDGTGKFKIPLAADFTGRTFYALDSLKYKTTGADSLVFATAKGDTGIIVDDTVRHFGGLSHVVGDFNNDGIMDLFFCSNGAENRNGLGVWGNVALIYGKGDGTFTYKWDGINIVADGLPNSYIRAWNAGDYDNNGTLDITTCDGTNTLLSNNGNGTFTNVTTAAALTGASLGFRAAALADYNNDGFLDYYSYTGGTSTLLKNNGNTKYWLGIKPVGVGKNIGAIGTLFTVYYAGGTKKLVRQISTQAAAGGFGGNLFANFGLDVNSTIDSVSAVWSDGVKQTWPAAAFTLKSYAKVVEGSVYLEAPAISRPSWAAGDSVDMPSNNTFKWKSVSGGTVPVKYAIQIGTSKAMSTLLQSYTGLTDTFKVAKVPLASKIFWRVAAISGGFQGPWSAVDSIKTNMTPATTIPTRLSPTHNQLRLPKQPTLVCSSTPEAYIYHFQLDTLNRFAGRDTLPQGAAKYAGLLFNDSTTVTDTAKQMSALTPGRMYYWRVRGWNAAGASNFSPVDSFTIMYLPLATTLAYPAHNQADVPANPLILRVNRVDGDSNYVFQTWTYTNAGLALRIDTTKNDPTLTLRNLFNRQKYYWKVQVYNQGGASAYTVVDSFTTLIEAPTAPLAISPKNTSDEQRKPTFVWRKATNAIWYHLQIATTNFNTPSDVVVDVQIQSDTTYTIADTLLASTLYYWHVSAVNLGGESSFSTSAKFITGSSVGVAQTIAAIPKDYALWQNYPNPFNPSTTISYDLPKASFVKLNIYDVLGRVVANLVEGVQTANRYRVEWNPSHLSSGTYFCRIQVHSQDGSADFTTVKKLLYMK